MKRLIVSGGLGNQMFEYALYLALVESKKKVCIDTSLYRSVKMHNGFELPRVFTLEGTNPVIKNSFLNNIMIRLILRFHDQRLIYKDGADDGFNEAVFNSRCKFIEGYFTSEKYFKEIESKVRKAFTFCGIDDRNEKLAVEMKSNNSVAVHIRRGDYAAFGMPLMGKEYYEKAIEFIRKKVAHPFFYVFSDDLKEADAIMESFKVDYKVVNLNRGEESYKDIFLMSQCKHHINANSTFSWWGAWLNNNKNKIVLTPYVKKDWAAEGWITL